MIDLEGRSSPVYEGSGTTGPFSFPFKVWKTDEVGVVIKESADAAPRILGPSEYTATLDEDKGGSVTLNTALATGGKLMIFSNVAYLQTVGLENMGLFNPEDLEKAWDTNTALIQQLKEKLDRAVVAPYFGESPEEFTESLLTARDEAVQAKGEAETACRAAESSAASAASSAERAEEVVSPVIGITSEIKTVADNIFHVVTDSNNIDAIKAAAEAKTAIQTVASDFTGEVPAPNIHDFGVWGVDSIPSTRPTGGTISKVAEGIEDVQTTAENIEAVKTLVAELPKAEEILEQVKGNASAAEAAQKAAVSARDAAKASETSAASSATNADQSATASATAQGAAEEAQRAAEEAAGAAQSAQGLAESAANSAGSAASAAHQYATNAQTSAGAAAQSENNAKGSADAAATSEKNAASSASAAAGSESAAKTSETNAKASETAAKNAQTAAESSKNAAASSASQAAQSAINAANSAASLSEAVQQASSSASAAAQSASAAQKSAQRAEEIADSLGDPLSKEEAAETYATKTALTQGLGTKAPSNHSHTSDQITDLDQKFAEKLSPYATTETVNSGLSGKANAAHTHTMDQISDLSFDFGKWEAA